LIGQTVGRYRILERLGLGGMATVYKGYDPTMDRYVAIKIPREELTRDSTFRARFTQEARTLARLEHPHILPVHDFGEDAGRYYLVMRFVDGSTLRDLLIQQHPLPLDRVLRLVGQVADALAYAHGSKVVHRDVKPGNVLVDKDGSALLTDFGIAKLLEEATHLTGTSESLGTPNYMAPEQVRGQTVDGRTDIYSLGVILYEAATGRCPFVAETPLAVALMHVTDPLPPPRQINPMVPEAIERVILQALAKDPAHRFQTAAAFAAALRAIPVEPSTPAPADATQLAPRLPASAGPAPVAPTPVPQPPQPHEPELTTPIAAPSVAPVPVVADVALRRLGMGLGGHARALFLAVGAGAVIVAVAVILLRAAPVPPTPTGLAPASPSTIATIESGGGAAALVRVTPVSTEVLPSATPADPSPTAVAQSGEAAATPTPVSAETPSPESADTPTPAESSPTELPTTLTPAADYASPTAMAPHVVATIPVGPNAGPAIGVNPDTNTIYVGNSAGNKVTVIDGSTNTVSTSIATSGTPDGLAVNPLTNLIYAWNVHGQGLFVIDGATNTVTATLGVGSRPMGVAVDASHSQFYVANGGSAGYSGSIQAFDGATNTRVWNVDVGPNPVGVGIEPSTYTIYAGDNDRGTVSVVNGHNQRVTATIPVGSKSEALAVDSGNSVVYVTNDDPGVVTVIDEETNKVATTMPVGSHPRGIAFDPDTNTVFVANSGSNSVSVIDAANKTVRATVPVAAGAFGIAICESTHHIYVVGSDTVTVLEP
jgi:serine/threonine-protein kinase